MCQWLLMCIMSCLKKKYNKCLKIQIAEWFNFEEKIATLTLAFWIKNSIIEKFLEKYKINLNHTIKAFRNKLNQTYSMAVLIKDLTKQKSYPDM